MYDVIIVGGGPAGITAGIYCQRANLKTVVFEKETIGGQIASSPLVKNFPGFKAEELGLPIEIEEVLEIIPGETNKVITDCDSYEARAVIVATGAKYRLLGLPNEENLIGRGISFCTSCDGSFYKGKDVAVIGGANTAVTNALYMSNLCPKVYLIYRGNKLKCEKVLLDSLKEKDNIEIIYNANVKEIIGKDELESIVLDNDRKIDIAGMFISIGMDAQTNLVKDLLPLSEQNYVLSEDCSTIKSSIFVAGDCRHKTIRQLTTAMSDGAVAASFAIKYLENNQ